MKRLLCLSLLILATGCSKNGTFMLRSSSGPVNATYVLDGQSNAARMNSSYITNLTGGVAINLAVGNTSLAQHVKGGEYYQNLIKTINERKGGPVTLIWYQGEWEGMNASGFDTWARRFTQFVNDVRGDTGLPNLKVYFFRINAHKYAPYPATWFDVRDQQDSVHIAGVTEISSDGCELSVDELHYTEAGYKCLAERVASEMGE